MLPIKILVSLYLILPAVFGYMGNLKLSLPKPPWYNQHFEKVRQWEPTTYAAIVFGLTTMAFFLVGFLAMSGMKLGNKLLISVLVANCLAALTFLYFYWDAAKLWSKYGGGLKALFVPSALAVTALSKIYSDAGIAELSGLAPQDLPSAQLFLTLIFTPIIWLMALSLAMGYLSLPLTLILLIRSLIHDHRRKNKESDDRSKNWNSHITAIVAIALCTIFSLTIMTKVVSKSVYEPRLRQAIAFSSFHLSTTFCGLPEVKNVYVAPMSDDRAALAIPDSKQAYRFVAISCESDKISNQEARELINEVIANDRNRSTGS
ncbi:hypothetical protein [Pseudomonas sp. SBB6]|uniref:hypothetical protein n=1 Tax=Pseudomonas sp. SBB6 TaxID=2962032 RepID=UPI0020B7712D|nr:hypothetical protein [Pseudomonas sp. SBB6]MCP3748617.1 hypothetical protein [Pseudomonas sp. SBB6]